MGLNPESSTAVSPAQHLHLANANLASDTDRNEILVEAVRCLQARFKDFGGKACALIPLLNVSKNLAKTEALQNILLDITQEGNRSLTLFAFQLEAFKATAKHDDGSRVTFQFIKEIANLLLETNRKGAPNVFLKDILRNVSGALAWRASLDDEGLPPLNLPPFGINQTNPHVLSRVELSLYLDLQRVEIESIDFSQKRKEAPRLDILNESLDFAGLAKDKLGGQRVELLRKYLIDLASLKACDSDKLVTQLKKFVIDESVFSLISPFSETLKWLKGRPSHEITRGLAIFSDFAAEIKDLNIPQQLINNYEASLKSGKISNIDQLKSTLKNIVARGATTLICSSAESKVDPDLLMKAWKTAAPKFAAYQSALADSYMFIRELGSVLYRWKDGDTLRERHNEVQSIERKFHAARSLGFTTWDRLNDLTTGFTAMKVSSQRLPDRSIAPYVQFGSTHGVVQYANCKDPNDFPGKGFLIRGLELNRLFPAQSTNHSDKFHDYKVAWPHLAAEFDLLPETSFLFLRGTLIITCLQKSEYSLVVFNDHFNNDLSRSAYLVPVAHLLRLGVFSNLIDFEDFTGFDSRKPDLAKILTSPEILISSGESVGPAIPVGEVSFLNSIIPTLNERDHQKAEEVWARSTQKLQNANMIQDEHNRRMRNLNRNMSMHYTRYAAEEELALNKMQQAISKIQKTVFDELAQESLKIREWLNSVEFRDVKSKLEYYKTANSLLNLFDLFRIADSQAQKGYTIPKSSQSEQLPQEGELSAEPADIFWNPQARVALNHMYAFNRQRQDEVWDLSRYPLLVVAETNCFSELPTKLEYLDSWDMKMHVDDKVYELNLYNPDERSEALWHSKFLPAAADEPGKFKTMRLLPREAVGLPLNPKKEQ